MQQTEPDRPSRKVEHFIQRTNELYVRLVELGNRYQIVVERLELGTDVKPEGTVPTERAAAVAVPELSELGDNIERMRVEVEHFEQMINIFEGI